MSNFIPSKTGLELFQTEALAIGNLINVLHDKIKNSPGLSKEELNFWIERLELLNSLAESDLGFLKVSEQIAKQALLN